MGYCSAVCLLQAKDKKILDSLKMQTQAQRLKEEEEELAKKNIKTQFSERLLNPTAGSRNLMRCLEAKKTPQAEIKSPSSSVSMKSITAKDLIMQHQQKLQEMKASQLKTTPQLGRGMSLEQTDIDLSVEVRLFEFLSIVL